MIRKVMLTASAEKSLKRCPLAIRQKLFLWVASIERRGLEEVKRQPGWHDESPCKAGGEVRDLFGSIGSGEQSM